MYVEEVPYGARHRKVHVPQFSDQRAELEDRKSPLVWGMASKDFNSFTRREGSWNVPFYD